MRKLPGTPTVLSIHDVSTFDSKCQTDCGYRELLELDAIFHQDSRLIWPPGIALGEPKRRRNHVQSSRTELFDNATR